MEDINNILELFVGKTIKKIHYNQTKDSFILQTEGGHIIEIEIKYRKGEDDMASLSFVLE